MKKSRILVLLLPGILLAALAMAGHHFNGKWVAEIETPRGTQRWAFHFKEENGALTGTVMLPNDSEAPIQDGKVEGNNISFQHAISIRGNDIELRYSGELKEDVIEFTRQLPNREQQFTAKKAE